MTTQIREPSVTANIVSANSATRTEAQKVLLIGYLSHSFGVPTNDQALYQNLGSQAEVDFMFGQTSMLANMYRTLRKENKTVRVDAITVQDNLGVDAEGQMQITGTATSNGKLTAIVGSAKDQTYTVDILEGDLDDDIMQKLYDLINANDFACVQPSISGNNIALTAEWSGLEANQIPLRLYCTANGFILSINEMAGGTGSVDTSTMFDLVEGIRYQTVGYGISESDYTNLETWLDSRWNVTNDVIDGVAITTVCRLYADQITDLGDSNCKNILWVADRLTTTDYETFSGGSVLEYSWNQTAELCGIRAGRRTEGFDISQWVVTASTSLDSVGGMAISSLPYFNTPLRFIPNMETGSDFGWSFDEQEAIRDEGGSVLGNSSGVSGNLICGEFLTTYKTDGAGDPDPTFKFLEYVDTISTIREYYVNRLRARFRQHRLTNGTLIAGRAMANGQLISGTCTAIYGELSKLALTQAGNEYVSFYKKNLTVALDLVAGSATIFMKMPIVTQLREIIATIQVNFTGED